MDRHLAAPPPREPGVDAARGQTGLVSSDGEVRYAKGGDVDIAYQTFGDASRDIVFVPGFVSHLDLMWELPPFAALRQRLTSVGRVTVFDKRGTGLSSRTLGFGSLAERMDDIRVVMDAAEIEQADLFGISEGGPLAMLFAATFPDRVSSLCLHGTMARALWAPDFPAGGPPELAEMFISWVEENWGTGQAIAVFMEAVPSAPELARMLARYERSACTPAQAGEILRSNMRIDVRHLLSTINTPCLVLHMQGDPLISADQARYLAAEIPGAAVRVGDGDYHVPWRSEGLNWLGERVEEFFRGVHSESAAEPDASSAPPQRRASRVLATVLFTDMVASTTRAAALGDSAWRSRLDQHDRISSALVTQHSGRIIKTTGDGIVAVFDSPSRAVECARDLVRSLGAADMPVRAGLHTGEVELRGSDIGGVGVHIASRVNSVAGESEVCVSRTVRDLIAGSGIELEPRGSHELKGFDEPWELYAAHV